MAHPGYRRMAPLNRTPNPAAAVATSRLSFKGDEFPGACCRLIRPGHPVLKIGPCPQGSEVARETLSKPRTGRANQGPQQPSQREYRIFYGYVNSTPKSGACQFQEQLTLIKDINSHYTNLDKISPRGSALITHLLDRLVTVLSNLRPHRVITA
jgi:hypothetical protein